MWPTDLEASSPLCFSLRFLPTSKPSTLPPWFDTWGACSSAAAWPAAWTPPTRLLAPPPRAPPSPANPQPQKTTWQLLAKNVSFERVWDFIKFSDQIFSLTTKRTWTFDETLTYWVFKLLTSRCSWFNSLWKINQPKLYTYIHRRKVEAHWLISAYFIPTSWINLYWAVNHRRPSENMTGSWFIF